MNPTTAADEGPDPNSGTREEFEPDVQSSSPFTPENEKVEYDLNDLAAISCGTVQQSQRSRPSCDHGQTLWDPRNPQRLRRLVRTKH